MKVDPSETLAGIPILRVRDFFRRAGGEWGTAYLREKMGFPEEEAERFLLGLAKLRYIERCQHSPGYWTLTDKALRLALASAARPVRRATAEKKLDEFLNRVAAVNADDRFAYQVARVVVFGSFLTDKEQLGDLDLAVELRPRRADPDAHQEKCRQRVCEALESGRWFGNIVEQVYWPQQEVLQFLKARSRTISLHSIDDPVLNRTPTRVVHQFESGALQCPSPS